MGWGYCIIIAGIFLFISGVLFLTFLNPYPNALGFQIDTMEGEPSSSFVEVINLDEGKV